MTDASISYNALLTDALDVVSASHSPCVGVCDHNEERGCSGCQRPHDEVAIWREVEPGIRQKRWQELPASLADHGISTMRLPLSQEAILQLANARLHDGGTWMLGGREYAIKASQPLDTLTATNTDQSAVINLASDIKMRAVLWAPHGHRLDEDISRLPIILVTPRIRIERNEGWHQRPQSARYPDIAYQSERIRICTNHDGGLMMESVIAAAEIKPETNRHASLPHELSDHADIPNGLHLPESYVHGLTLLPPDMTIS
jgi:predicted Fe-S protein YdhL (DUF1289 family)